MDDATKPQIVPIGGLAEQVSQEMAEWREQAIADMKEAISAGGSVSHPAGREELLAWEKLESYRSRFPLMIMESLPADDHELATALAKESQYLTIPASLFSQRMSSEDFNAIADRLGCKREHFVSTAARKMEKQGLTQLPLWLREAEKLGPVAYDRTCRALGVNPASPRPEIIRSFVATALDREIGYESARAEAARIVAGDLEQEALSQGAPVGWDQWIPDASSLNVGD